MINLADFAVFSHSWLSVPADGQWYILCDLFEDGQMDSMDLAGFVNDWLWQAAWHEN